MAEINQAIISWCYKQINSKDQVPQLLKSIYSELRAINLYMEGAAFSVSIICWYSFWRRISDILGYQSAWFLWGIFNYVLIMFEKKSFKTFAISLSLVIIFSLSTNVIFSLLTNLFGSIGLPFSKIFDYLWHFFRLSSNNSTHLSLLIDIHINLFVLQIFAYLSYFYSLDIYFLNLNSS